LAHAMNKILVRPLMRYGIFSDIHSNLEAFNKVIEAYKKESIDTYLCVGDIVGYGANPNECIEKTKALTNIVVAGNHDWACVDLFSVEYFNPYAKEAVFWTKQHLDQEKRYFLEALRLVYRNENLTLVHGTLDDPGEFNYMTDSHAALETFGLQETAISFVGHSHVAGIFILDKGNRLRYRQDDLSHINIEDGNKYIANVGSVGQPRDNDPRAAYCVFDTEKKELQIKRIAYDVEAARKKIIGSGLPKFLGDRLLVGG